MTRVNLCGIWPSNERLGPVVRVGTNNVDVADLEGVQRIHRIQGEFLKADWYTTLLPGINNVFSTRNKDLHRRFRRLLSSPMSESNLKSMHHTIEAKVQLAIHRMREEMETRGCADIAKWWMFMATDVIGELTFGESFRMLEFGRVSWCSAC